MSEVLKHAYLDVDDTGKVEMSADLWRALLRHAGVRSKKRRIQKKVVRRVLMAAIREGMGK